MKALLFCLISVLFLSNCSSKKSTVHTVTLHKYIPTPKSEEPQYKLKSKTSVKVALLQEFEKWKNTPYYYGGQTHKGIDCSAFVQSIYKEAFRITLPRSTKGQAKSGYETSRKDIKAGDIVLFKTGWNTKHSGIYLEKGNFMHVSTKLGIIISNLNNPYWRENYWQTRRVLP